MAKILMTAIVADIRGKLNGTVFSKNKAGAYMRTKVTPNNPDTQAQKTVRNNFTANSQGWKGLTAAQRQAWNSAVQDFIGTDVFGSSKILSGFQLFCRLNNNIRFISETPITDPPTPASVPAFTSCSLAVVKTADAVTVTFAPAIDATEKVILSATAGQSAGKNFVKSEYRMIQILTNAETSPHVATTEYEAKFGDTPAIGRKVFVTMKQIVIASGLSGATISASDIVEAAA